VCKIGDHLEWLELQRSKRTFNIGEEVEQIDAFSLQKRILQLIGDGKVSLPDIAQRLSVSEEKIRKIIEHLLVKRNPTKLMIHTPDLRVDQRLLVTTKTSITTPNGEVYQLRKKANKRILVESDENGETYYYRENSIHNQ
jgi:hypothetical protein